MGGRYRDEDTSSLLDPIQSKLDSFDLEAKKGVMTYEMHITIPLGWKRKAKPLAEVFGWSYSEIMGDPELGFEKPYAYVNGHAAELKDARAKLNLLVSLCLTLGIGVIRSKIEMIIDDRRYQDLAEV